MRRRYRKIIRRIETRDIVDLLVLQHEERRFK